MTSKDVRAVRKATEDERVELRYAHQAAPEMPHQGIAGTRDEVESLICARRSLIADAVRVVATADGAEVGQWLAGEQRVRWY